MDNDVKARKKSGKNSKWVATPAMIKTIHHLAGLGLSQHQIHQYWGISVETWFDALKRQPELCAAVAKGKASTIAMVAGKLMDKIKKGDRASIIFYLSRQARWFEPKEAEPPLVPPADTIKLTVAGKDPIEAARIYAEIMIGTKP